MKRPEFRIADARKIDIQTGRSRDLYDAAETELDEEWEEKEQREVHEAFVDDFFRDFYEDLDFAESTEMIFSCVERSLKVIEREDMSFAFYRVVNAAAMRLMEVLEQQDARLVALHELYTIIPILPFSSGNSTERKIKNIFRYPEIAAFTAFYESRAHSGVVSRKGEVDTSQRIEVDKVELLRGVARDVAGDGPVTPEMLQPYLTLFDEADGWGSSTERKFPRLENLQESIAIHEAFGFPLQREMTEDEYISFANISRDIWSIVEKNTPYEEMEIKIGAYVVQLQEASKKADLLFDVKQVFSNFTTEIDRRDAIDTSRYLKAFGALRLALGIDSISIINGESDGFEARHFLSWVVENFETDGEFQSRLVILAQAFGLRWSPGEPWPDHEFGRMIFEGLLRKGSTQWTLGELPKTASAVLNMPPVFTPVFVKEYLGQIGWQSEGSAEVSKEGQESFWIDLRSVLENQYIGSEQVETIVGHFEAIEMLLGNEVHWPKHVPLPDPGRVYNALTRLFGFDNESYAEVASFLLEKSVPHYTDDLPERISLALLTEAPHHVDGLLYIAASVECALPSVTDHIQYRFSHASHASERIAWLEIHKKYAEGELPLKPVEKLHLLRKILDSGDGGAESFPTLLEAVCAKEDSRIFALQRKLLEKHDWSHIHKPFDTWIEVSRVFDLSADATPKYIIEYAIQNNKLAEAIETFGYVPVGTHLSASIIEGRMNHQFRGLVVGQRLLLEKLRAFKNPEEDADGVSGSFKEKDARRAVADPQGGIDMVLKLASMQAPVANEAHDPWHKYLSHLVNEMMVDGRVASAELLSFVDAYGMAYLPRLIEIHLALSRATSFADIDKSIRLDLRAVGIRVSSDTQPEKWPYAAPKSILPELKKWIQELATALLKDQVLYGIDGRLGEELFKALLGETQWGRGDALRTNMDDWEENVRQHPEQGKVPAAFMPAVFSVARVERSFQKRDTEGEKKTVEKILQSPEMQQRYIPLAESVREAVHVRAQEASLPTLFSETRDTVLIKLNQMIADLTLVGYTADAAFAATVAAEPDAARRKQLEGKRKGMQLKFSPDDTEERKLEKTMARNKMIEKEMGVLVGRRTASEDLFTSASTIETLRDWVAVNEGIIPDAGKYLRVVSLFEMWPLMTPAQREGLQEHFSEEGDLKRPEKIAALSGFLKDYVREHYLDKEQRTEHTGHEPFSKDTYRALERAWQAIESKKGTLPLEDLNKKLQEIISPTGEVSVKKQQVSMVPVAGLLRLYAGEVGDACYSSKREEMAKGKYPLLRSWMYVTEDAAGRPSLRGSVLGLEVKSDKGVDTLVVRANNPKESFIQSVDADALVMASLKEAVATARRLREERLRETGIASSQVVVIPIDQATASCSNRSLVANSYHKRFKENPRTGLERSPESTFKYDLTNPHGYNPCVAIWSCDADGKETWHGDWKEKEAAS